MQFLAISRRRTERFDDAAFSAHIDAERERVRELYKEGIVRSIWSRADVAGGVMLLECADEAAARAAFDSLPLARLGMLDLQLVPLNPYPAFFPRTAW
ncbi:MAG TPA: muconolactone Delta-isomerase family protein [Candidatus Baltobacteraceae bacterium]|nr:muconolactone Delta-isomerase family protein [Candidatus Baltobacteraceae bacterium]